MTKNKGIGKGRSGRSRNGGRPPGPHQILRFSKKDARIIHLLRDHYRALYQRPDLTHEQAVMRLAEDKWHDIDQAYQEAAEIAREPHIL